MTYWAEVVETDVFTARLFYITSEYDFLTVRQERAYRKAACSS